MVPLRILYLQERLYMSEIKTELKCKDRRSVHRWCRNNSVLILNDIGRNRLYVIKDEFESAKQEETIKHIIQKYGLEKLPEVLQAKMNFYSEYRTAFEEKNNNHKKYLPQGEHEKNFFSILTNPDFEQ